jgi:hypothetical protein
LLLFYSKILKLFGYKILEIKGLEVGDIHKILFLVLFPRDFDLSGSRGMDFKIKNDIPALPEFGYFGGGVAAHNKRLKFGERIFCQDFGCNWANLGVVFENGAKKLPCGGHQSSG